MDIWNIILTAGVASVVTLLANLIIQGSQYKKEFYHKIIDIRIDAYKHLNSLTCLMSTITYKGKNKYLTCLVSLNNYEDLLKKITQTYDYELWFSLEATKKYQELIHLLIRKIGLNFQNGDAEILKKGQSIFMELPKQVYELRKIIHNDLSNVYKVKDFFDERSNIESKEMSDTLNQSINRLKKQANQSNA